jgi:hypothetical protein
MNEHRRGPEGPPLEAYSRVTNSQRFAPLHNLATELLDRLELEFDVERAQGPGLDPELEERCDAAHPSISLVPRAMGATPITVIFTAFPGLYVRFGRWCTTAFPTCGCDACDETIEREAERFRSMIEDLIAGRFREAIVMPAGGAAWLEWEFWQSAAVRSVQRSQLDAARAQELRGGRDQGSYQWQPWPRRRRLV